MKIATQTIATLIRKRRASSEAACEYASRRSTASASAASLLGGAGTSAVTDSSCPYAAGEVEALPQSAASFGSVTVMSVLYHLQENPLSVPSSCMSWMIPD